MNTLTAEITSTPENEIVIDDMSKELLMEIKDHLEAEFKPMVIAIDKGLTHHLDND
ncbi:hypothetical protein HWQ46_00020 [Shewanella sp. D64]|uniref:hypothetical protein n=1 Tax=unclassified Shewanella TaxID=196818 RepID=UPI0022BA6880|nr:MULTISPECIES: hypothetical protein [unclassified Shewanella]MEC4723940.1 hypothetical protein [Shewanella sp. D64]MEC4735960.1 hypothetical protein [Shewanella sp. E94]WBJ93074.1 hypothetical protein HWQ47_13890 [Shewanella sp. MTB7]